ncbi:hypothetical protein C1H76_5665 [Elsinoe australis]|uniref:Uncharacterized protein n=1 Tax=Elsinoe australis TaxID=40998 RepID=A0A4V6DTU7_9PEZI|nr:hypothetical protein C1H76_5665 [Elsinoe australis]
MSPEQIQVQPIRPKTRKIRIPTPPSTSASDFQLPNDSIPFYACVIM